MHRFILTLLLLPNMMRSTCRIRGVVAEQLRSSGIREASCAGSHLCCGTEINKLHPGCVRRVKPDHNLCHDPKMLQLPQQTRLQVFWLLGWGSCCTACCVLPGQPVPRSQPLNADPHRVACMSQEAVGCRAGTQSISSLEPLCHTWCLECGIFDLHRGRWSPAAQHMRLPASFWSR